MKITGTCISICFFICLRAIAQDKGSLAGTFGPCFPVGQFASKDITNDKAGMAKTGMVFDLSFGYKLSRFFGIAAMLRGQSNPIDVSPFIRDYQRIAPGIIWTATTKSWSTGGFFAGSYGSFPVPEYRAHLTTRILFGVIQATSPDIKINGAQNGLIASAELNPATSTTMAILIGAGFEFDISQKICLVTDLDWMDATPEFRNVKTTYSFGSYEEHTIKQSLVTINLNLGIGLKL